MKFCKLLLLAAVAPAAVAAWAQGAKLAPAGEAYPIANSTDATGVGTRSYQWFRNDTIISAATGASYTVPAGSAYGSKVRFVRRAMYDGACDGAGIALSNTVTVTFVEPAPPGCNLFVAGVCWADANTEGKRSFAARADSIGSFYQWNRLKAWPPRGAVSGWSVISGPNWHADSVPCPAGWRLPTEEDFQNLHDFTFPDGGVWADANTKGNAVAGKFYGNNAGSCTLAQAGAMKGCIFLPAAGYRDGADGAIKQSASGYYWSSTRVDYGPPSNIIYYFFLNFSSNSSYFNGNYYASEGKLIRCVQ